MIHRTRRGELLARLEYKRYSAGMYAVEGFTVTCIAGTWYVRNGATETGRYPTFTDALEAIADHIDKTS